MEMVRSVCETHALKSHSPPVSKVYIRNWFIEGLYFFACGGNNTLLVKVFLHLVSCRGMAHKQL